MKTFVKEDFLLYNDMARYLYHDIAKEMPIIDYHNHLDIEEIASDKQFLTISEIWLSSDHYKWRAMRANGVQEKYITGDSSPYKKFMAWAETVPKMLGNPLYHWTHLELLRYFDIDIILNEKTAQEIWEEANRQLQLPNMSARALLEKKRVSFIGTTDDPTDTLNTHAELLEHDFSVKVSPSFRPDKGLAINEEEFSSWVQKLERLTNTSISSYDDFLKCLSLRIEAFDKLGCRSADHGINIMFYEKATKKEINNIFTKRLQEEKLSSTEVNKFKTYTLAVLGEMYEEKKWAMQLHIGPLRNTNTRMYGNIGPDSGYDSIGDGAVASEVSKFLDTLELKDKLPKTILYSLNPKDYYVLSTMAGNYQDSSIPGKIQFGAAWWFNDHIDGIENQMNILANTGLISNFIGMLTDSRSLLSFSRHEYFRRILCNFIGVWVEEGKVPRDRELLAQYVKDICYFNAKRYFRI